MRENDLYERVNAFFVRATCNETTLIELLRIQNVHQQRAGLQPVEITW
jgi:hypothetical protein